MKKKIETTINLNVNLYNELYRVSNALSISKNHIIKLLLKKIEGSNIKTELFNPVKYQGKDFKQNWKKFHLELSPIEYEYFTDMRNFYKMSLSLIIAKAIKKYLNLLFELSKYKIATDKYLFPAYHLIESLENEVKSYTIYWGKPREKPKLGEK